METTLSYYNIKQKILFKSYYVVWKLNSMAKTDIKKNTV